MPNHAKQWVAAGLAGVAVAGCASTTTPITKTQSARYGFVVTWDRSHTGDTQAADLKLAAGCGYGTPADAGNLSGNDPAVYQTYFPVPGGVLSDAAAMCFTNSSLVLGLDLLGAPYGRGR